MYPCFFCGGKECKYENYKLWPENSIEGLYSNWITPHILAMQRPSTRLIKEHNLINVFLGHNIRSVFNLQSYGEHVSCGDGIEASSGFSYLPEQFMDSGISYYNFGWPDMDTPDLDLMLNIVNVMSFAMETEKKISVHCHAGLGRTGLSIACYLIYSEGLLASTAILLVRGKRPLSVQTRKQSQFVLDFENHLKKLKVSFIGTGLQKSVKDNLTFGDYIANQRRWMKNAELRYLRYIPKVLYVILNRIIKICSESENEISWYKALDAFIQFEGIKSLDYQMIKAQTCVNNSEWGFIEQEEDVSFLVDLLLYWIVSLSNPIIADAAVTLLALSKDPVETKVDLLNKEIFETINYILRFFREIPAISKSTLALAFERLAIYLTSHRSSLSKMPPPPSPVEHIKPVLSDPFKSLRVVQTAMAHNMTTINQGLTVMNQNISTMNPMEMVQNIKHHAEVIVSMTRSKSPEKKDNKVAVDAKVPISVIPAVPAVAGIVAVKPPTKSSQNLVPDAVAIDSAIIIASPENPPAVEDLEPEVVVESDNGIGASTEKIENAGGVKDPVQVTEMVLSSKPIEPLPVLVVIPKKEPVDLEGLKSLLAHICGTMSVTELNVAIINATKKPVFQHGEWKSASEVVLKLPHGSQKNLSELLKQKVELPKHIVSQHEIVDNLVPVTDDCSLFDETELDKVYQDLSVKSGLTHNEGPAVAIQSST